MAGKTDVVENEQTVEEQPLATEAEIQQAETEEAAAFAQSFDKEARVDETPAEVQDEEQADETVDDAAGDVAAEVETAPEEQVGVTAEQLTAMLAKLPQIDENELMTKAELRKLHGKIGEINQGLQELKKSGNKSAVKLTGAQFKRLHAEYPDLAELLAEDLNEGTETAEATQEAEVTTQPNENFDERVAKVKDDLSKEMQTNLLRIQHRDFLDVVQSDDFKVWTQTLSKEDQAQLADSWDAVYLGEKITGFKTWYEKKQTGTQERKERLERAITPKGTQAAMKPVAMTELDGFNAAFTKK